MRRLIGSVPRNLVKLTFKHPDFRFARHVRGLNLSVGSFGSVADSVQT